ncbi:MAG: E3 binding domain-containing protein [Alteraurantiacibacter sp.]
MAASPLARRMAAEKGIDLASIHGTGPNGMIVKADVENFDPANAKAADPARAAQPEQPTAGAGNDLDTPYESMKLNAVRKVIARRLTEAKQMSYALSPLRENSGFILGQLPPRLIC